MLDSITQNGDAFAHASQRLQGNRPFVMAAVKVSGWALEYATVELRDDFEVVSAACRQNEWAIEFASSRVRALLCPKCIVLTGVGCGSRTALYSRFRLPCGVL